MHANFSSRSLRALAQRHSRRGRLSSTRGPALTGAAQLRLRRGGSKAFRSRTSRGSYTITAITLDPSYATATAVVRSQQRVAPYEVRAPLGKQISLPSTLASELHRLGNTERFIVWRVSRSNEDDSAHLSPSACLLLAPPAA